MTTTPPGRHVLFYDGHCKFCIAGSERLARLARRGAVERVDFQRPGALDRVVPLPHPLTEAGLSVSANDKHRIGAGPA